MGRYHINTGKSDRTSKLKGGGKGCQGGRALLISKLPQKERIQMNPKTVKKKIRENIWSMEMR